MAQGRKKKPDSMKVVQGTFRSDRANPDAPNQDGDGLTVPEWLPEDCVAHFLTIRDRISVYNLDSASWTEAAAMIAMRVAEIEACNEIIANEGRTYRSETATKGGQVKVMIKGHPAVSQRSEAMRHLQSLLSEFGLTPAAISKVSANGGGGNEEADPWENFG
jgi:P27 family predicted phage terminase small subunit